MRESSTNRRRSRSRNRRRSRSRSRSRSESSRRRRRSSKRSNRSRSRRRSSSNRRRRSRSKSRSRSRSRSSSREVLPNPSPVKGRFVRVFVKGEPEQEVLVQVAFCKEWLVNCRDLMVMSGTPETRVSKVFRSDRGYLVTTLTEGEVQTCGGVFNSKSSQWIGIAAAGMYLFSLRSLGTGDAHKTKLEAYQALMLPALEVFAVQPPPRQFASVRVQPVAPADPEERKVRKGTDDLEGMNRDAEVRRRAETVWAALRSANLPFSDANEEHPISQIDELTQNEFEFPAAKGKHPHIIGRLFLFCFFGR